MKTKLAPLLALAFAFGAAHAEEEKKPAKPKPAARKSDKNVFQKAESAIMDSAHRNKIWVQHSKNKKKKD